MTDNAKFWDKSAERYAASPVSDERAYQRKLAETQGLFGPQMRILEFGCGTGTTAIHHAPHVAHIDAIDISGNMLEIARSRITASEIENITLTRGTLTGFGADPASMDVVLGLNVLHLLPDREAAIAEAFRILRPGGAFVTSTVCLGASYLRFLKLVAPIGKLFGLIPDIYVLSEQQLRSEMEAQGFDIETQWAHGKNDIAVFAIARKPAG